MEHLLSVDRKPINLLFQEEIGKGKTISGIIGSKFNMYRVLETSSFSAAVSFAYLETLLRPTTFPQEYLQALQCLPRRVQKILGRCRTKALPAEELALHATQESLKAMAPAPIIVKLYRPEGNNVSIEVKAPLVEGSLPVCHILRLKEIHVLLYTPTMTFVDKYDPFTGNPNDVDIPSLLLKKARTSLFGSQKRKKVKKMLMIKTQFEEDCQSPVLSNNSSAHGGIVSGLAVFSPRDFMTNEPTEVGRKSVPRPHSFSQDLGAYSRPVVGRDGRRCCNDQCGLFQMDFSYGY